VMQSSNTITNGIQGPQAIAFDGLGDLWVQNDDLFLTMYSPTSAYAPPSSLVQTINSPSGTLYSVGEGGGVLLTGTSTVICYGSASAILRGGTSLCDAFDSVGATAFAADSSGAVYAATLGSNNDVNVELANGGFFTFTSLPFASSHGMAVDNVHHRLYVSNTTGNQIAVYSTTGTTYGKLIHTIHN